MVQKKNRVWDNTEDKLMLPKFTVFQEKKGQPKLNEEDERKLYQKERQERKEKKLLKHKKATAQKKSGKKETEWKVEMFDDVKEPERYSDDSDMEEEDEDEDVE